MILMIYATFAWLRLLARQELVETKQYCYVIGDEGSKIG
jgi:hypothetical protein